MSLAGAPEERVQRRQLVDTHPAPPPTITEYQRVSKRCPTCETVTTPGWDDVAVPVEHAEIVSAPGSPVRIGPETIARAALLTCAHYLPIGRARELLEALTGIDVSTGFLAGTADARRGGWKKASCPTCGRCWPARRCYTPTRLPGAPPAPCPRSTSRAPNS